MDRLLEVSRECILRNAHARLRSRRDMLSAPLWYFVREMCGVGSTSAITICRELNWDPNSLASKKLPERT